MNNQQRGLFDNQPNDLVSAPNLAQVIGLRYIPEFISCEQHDELLRQIDAELWLTDLKRRVQHYGYKYNYKSRSVDQAMRIGPLPAWAEALGEMLCKQGLMSENPDQVIVNEYEPGQGIANHIDCVPCFADTIISLSLGSACLMELTNKATDQVIPVLLEPRSLIVLQEDARFVWTHGIPARKSDKYGNHVINRQRRVSLTFRKVIFPKQNAAPASKTTPLVILSEPRNDQPTV
ncbi:MAG: alpha-ketoglutarate-dependent dioxygenase AlkB [Planctomycetota bacterium]